MTRRRFDQTAFGLHTFAKHVSRTCLTRTPSTRVFHRCWSMSVCGVFFLCDPLHVPRRISSLVTPAEVDASLETSPLALNQARKRFARGRLERACDVDADRCQQIEESPPTPLQRRIEPPLWRLQRLQNEADALRSWTDAHSSMRSVAIP